MLWFQVFMEVFVFFLQTIDLVLSLGCQLVWECFEALSQAGKLNAVLSSKSIQGSLYPFVTLFEPTSFLCFFSCEYELLDIMCLCKARYCKDYFFCLTICSSIFLRFKSSELSLTFGESYISSSFLNDSISCLCLASISFSAFSASWLVSLFFWSMRLLKLASSSLLALESSLYYRLCRISIS